MAVFILNMPAFLLQTRVLEALLSFKPVFWLSANYYFFKKHILKQDLLPIDDFLLRIIFKTFHIQI